MEYSLHMICTFALEMSVRAPPCFVDSLHRVQGYVCLVDVELLNCNPAEGDRWFLLDLMCRPVVNVSYRQVYFKLSFPSVAFV